MTDLFLPLILACTAGYALYRRVDLFPTLLCGVEKGLRTALHILPTMIVILTAVRMLRVSGFVDLMGQAWRPLLQLTGIPEECTTLLLLKPISGSGGLALGQDIMRTCGVDSVQGRTAAVMLGASETSLYTISVYCGTPFPQRCLQILPLLFARRGLFAYCINWRKWIESPSMHSIMT